MTCLYFDVPLQAYDSFLCTVVYVYLSQIALNWSKFRTVALYKYTNTMLVGQAEMKSILFKHFGLVSQYIVSEIFLSPSNFDKKKQT